MNDLESLVNAAALCRRRAAECRDFGRRETYLEMAAVFEIALTRLGHPSGVAETMALEADAPRGD